MSERGKCLAIGGAGLAAWAAATSLWAAGPIYSCTDASGKRLTSDRPIAECMAREQRVLNPDGSVRKVIPPTPTADERAEQEARERAIVAERAARAEAIRRDRSLMIRFPNEAAHDKARNAALDSTRAALSRSERRLAELAAERKPLLAESQFYAGKPLPAKLQQQLESNDTAVEAMRVLVQNQQSEIQRVNAVYDADLARLRKLWAGAPPGTLGAISVAPAAATASTASSVSAASAATSGVRKTSAR